MVAHNRAHEGKSSKVKSIIFDAESDLGPVTNLQVVSNTENNITLKWQYVKPVDGFMVTITVQQPYPFMLPRLTKLQNVTITNLAPGTYYTFKVLHNTFKMSIVVFYL